MNHPGFDSSNTNPTEEPAPPAYPYAPAAFPANVVPPTATPPLTPAYSAGDAPVPAPAPAAPGYAPPTPVPAAPVFDPAMAHPYSAQPYSGPPISGAYGYGGPMQTSAIPAPPEKRGRVGTIILSVLTTLFLVAAGVLGTLFVLKNSEARRLDAQVTRLSGEVTTHKTKIDTLQKDLENARRDLTDAKGQADELTNQKKVITDCVNAIYAFFEAVDKANGANTKPVQDAQKNVNTKCDEADKYLSA